MRIEGLLEKSGNWWAAEIPLLKVYTQGKTKKEAYEMVKDAVECLIEEKGFKATVFSEKNNRFSVGSNNNGALMAFALKQQRDHHKLSAREMALRLGINSPSAYTKYESGKIKPSIDKFSQLLRAIDPQLEPILRFSQ